MKYINLRTPGKQAIVDDEDFDMLSTINWHLIDGYAYTNKSQDTGHRAMHRLLMNPPKGMVVDHINHDRLDNRRSNLRIVTFAQNQWNRDKQSQNTSGHKGVTLERGKWRSRIKVNGKQITLGMFEDILEAANAYKMAEERYRSGFTNYRNVA